jgi:3-dehydroquinate synthase
MAAGKGGLMRELTVELGARRYPIRIGPGLLEDAEMLAALVPGRHALIVTDSNVAPHYLAPLQHALADKTIAVFTLPPGEREKNLSRFAEVIDTLARLGAHRDATVVALGGGVVGDLAGFVAACWMRGVRFLPLPTTLLAMIDASVGGKTALDLPQGKNLIGAFHQPVAVIADTSTLDTLPARELRAGLAEAVKYAAIADAEFFAWLEAQAEALLTRDPEALAHAIAVCCAGKAGIVARDETEQGERLLLNFGHTIGHAIEAEQGYGERASNPEQTLLHGEAVAIGMMSATRLSERLGCATAADTERLRTLLMRLGLPTDLPTEISAAALLERMRLDKKAVSGALRLILWHGPGRAEVVCDVDEALVLAVLIRG